MSRFRTSPRLGCVERFRKLARSRGVAALIGITALVAITAVPGFALASPSFSRAAGAVSLPLGITGLSWSTTAESRELAAEREGTGLWVIRLAEPSLAAYAGGVPGLTPTSPPGHGCAQAGSPWAGQRRIPELPQEQTGTIRGSDEPGSWPFGRGPVPIPQPYSMLSAGVRPCPRHRAPAPAPC